MFEERTGRDTANLAMLLFRLGIVITFVVMVALGDLGGSNAGFIFLMRMQVLALVAWGAAGVIGVLAGDGLRYRKGSAYLDTIDD